MKIHIDGKVSGKANNMLIAEKYLNDRATTLVKIVEPKMILRRLKSAGLQSLKN